MDIFRLIEKEHERLKSLISQLLEPSENGGPPVEAVRRLSDELRQYLASEEEVFYSSLHHEPRVAEVLASCRLQHWYLRSLLDEIDAHCRERRVNGDRLQELGLRVDRLFREEEEELLVTARGLFERARAVELAGRLFGANGGRI